MRFVIFIIVLILLCVAMYAYEKNKSDKLNKEIKKDNDRKVVRTLVNSESELYEFVKCYINEAADEALLNGGNEYTIFKHNICKYILYRLYEEIEENGTWWIDSKVSHIVDKENLEMSVALIMNMTSIDNQISDLFVNKITNNIIEAETNERNAIESNKEFDSAPGKDEELHPRIPNPGEDREEEITEMSIEALTSAGTVENVD